MVNDPEIDALLRKVEAEPPSSSRLRMDREPSVDKEDACFAVEDLVPPCARGANSAIYGYDIQLLREKPWQQPGAVLSDYFNYDFDEASYRAYCAMHPNGGNSVKLKAEEYVTKLFGSMPAPPPSGLSIVPDNAFRGPFISARPTKTKPCFAFRNGTCVKGDHCTYAHSDEEMMAAQASYHSLMLSQSAPPQPPPDFNLGQHRPVYYSSEANQSYPPPMLFQNPSHPHHQNMYITQPLSQQPPPQYHTIANTAVSMPQMRPQNTKPNDDDGVFETPPVPPARH